MTITQVFKLVDRAEWEAAVAAGVYLGSAVDRADGYIHLSTRDQVAETAARHYRGRQDLLILTVDLAGDTSGLRWEPSRGGALFPHIHGPLSPDRVSRARSLGVGDDGRMAIADGSDL